MLQQHPGLYFAPSGKHRFGMYCTEEIAAGSVIEICPVIIIPGEQAKQIVRGYILYEYYFEWKKESIAIALGYGSIYNHASAPNAEFQPDYQHQYIIFKAVKDIPPGTEILVDYHAGNPEEKVWFEVNP
jgi:SET domain-containing protein